MSFIILGNQRSGTNFILDVINHHPDVQTINEPFSMHLDFFHNNEEPWEGESFNDVYLHEKLKGLDETITFIQDLNRWMNCDYPMVRGFKETGLFEKFDWLYRAVRPKRVVIIVRDFRAIVNSVLRRNLHRNKWNYERILFEHYGIKGMNNDAELCAKLISLRTNYLIRIHEKYGCPIIRLEDIIRFPQQNVSLLMEELGLHYTEKQILFIQESQRKTLDYTYSNYRKIEDVITRWQKDLSKAQIDDITGILINQLSYFGYSEKINELY